MTMCTLAELINAKLQAARDAKGVVSVNLHNPSSAVLSIIAEYGGREVCRVREEYFTTVTVEVPTIWRDKEERREAENYDLFPKSDEEEIILLIPSPLMAIMSDYRQTYTVTPRIDVQEVL